MADARLLALKAAIKDRKPTFLRQDAHKRKKLADKWRRPKGMHSKMRRKLVSRRVQPSRGYSSPRLVRGMNSRGLREIVVYNVNDLARIDSKINAVVVGKVGQKNKLAIIKASLEKKLIFANVKDAAAFIAGVESKLAQNKKSRKDKAEKRKTVEEGQKKVKKEDKKESPQATAEAKDETKKGDKSEKIKVLEKRQ